MHVRDLYDTNFGTLEVVEYTNKSKVRVRFIETGYEKFARYDHILNGSVKDNLRPSVFGVGFIGDEVTRTKEGRPLSYKYWVGMLQRAYCKKYKALKNTYIDCTTSENFKSYPYFKEWCERQIGYGNKGWALDKDILVKGNKVYSEDVCCFIPPEINSIVVSKKSIRGCYPIGVTKHKKMTSFSSSVSIDGTMKYLGSFSTPEEAFLAYKEAKEQQIKVVANRWKDQIDPRVYDALMNWEVDITD